MGIIARIILKLLITFGLIVVVRQMLNSSPCSFHSPLCDQKPQRFFFLCGRFKANLKGSTGPSLRAQIDAIRHVAQIKCVTWVDNVRPFSIIMETTKSFNVVITVVGRNIYETRVFKDFSLYILFVGSSVRSIRSAQY